MTTIIQVVKTVPVTVESQLRGLITEIGGTPADHVTQDPRKLWEWGVQLATLLITLNTDLVGAEFSYNKVVSLLRNEYKDASNVEITMRAGVTQEWIEYHRLKNLSKDAREMLMVVKKFQQQFMEERQFSREIQL